MPPGKFNYHFNYQKSQLKKIEFQAILNSVGEDGIVFTNSLVKVTLKELEKERKYMEKMKLESANEYARKSSSDTKNKEDYCKHNV